MLLIILLGVITKMAVVSTECHIGNINRNIDWTAVSYSDTSLNAVNVKMSKNMKTCLTVFSVRTV
jgi:hypothetical protein